MSKLHQPFMSPSPWSLPSRRSGENVYADFEFWADNVNFPDGYRLMDQGPHPEYFEHMYSMSAGDKSEMTSEWLKVWAATYGGINYAISTGGNWAGYYIVKHGRYVPSMVAGGYTTNTVDFSKKYDAMRGVLWNYWTNTNASDQHNVCIAETPTVGTVNFGKIYLACDRNYLNEWRIWGLDGDGNAIGPAYLAGSVKVQLDSCGLQWEFVKGSHITLKMYINIPTSLNFSTFTMPTWPIEETGTYAKVALTTGSLPKLVPTSILVSAGSAVDAGNGRHARLAYEYRAIGKSDWKYLK